LIFATSIIYTPLFDLKILESLIERWVLMELTEDRSNAAVSLTVEKGNTLSNSIKESLFEMDLNGNFLKVPPSLEEITGFSGEELDRLSLYDVTFMEDKDKIVSAMDAIKEGAPLITENIEIFSECGGSHSVELILLPLAFDGEIRGMWGVMKDVAQRMDLERELEAIQEIQNVSQRFFSDFVSLLTREIRQPLTTILLTLEMLDSGSFGELNDAQTMRVSQLIDIIDRLKNTLNDALDMSRNLDEQIKLERRSVSVEKMIGSVVASREKDISRSGIKIAVNLHNNIVKAEVDGKAIVQVISTLLDRAVRASPESGQVNIEVEEREKDLLFSISDSGAGIPENELCQLFERLPIDDEKEIGEFSEGVNLYIAKRLIEKHGGRIWCESFVGLGTTYLFTIPRSTEGEECS
jgi:PAS domain S-box-containing protein